MTVKYENINEENHLISYWIQIIKLFRLSRFRIFYSTNITIRNIE